MAKWSWVDVLATGGLLVAVWANPFTDDTRHQIMTGISVLILWGGHKAKNLADLLDQRHDDHTERLESLESQVRAIGIEILERKP